MLVDALTRRTWVKEDDLANAVLLSAKQVRKALLYLEEQRLVTRAHVKEKDKDRAPHARARAVRTRWTIAAMPAAPSTKIVGAG